MTTVGSLAVIPVAGFAVLCAWVVVTLGRRPVVRSVTAGYLRRQPGRTVLVGCGVALGTTIIVAGSVLADSVDASLTARAREQLGPIDEILVGNPGNGGHDLEALADRAGIPADGRLPFTAVTTTISAPGFVPFIEPQAQVVEVDFDRARAFGGDPTLTGIDGPTPAGNEAVINLDLAQRLHVGVGGRIQVPLFGTTQTFRVARIVPVRGIAGLQGQLAAASSRAPNLFVAPGTLTRVRDAAIVAAGTESGGQPVGPVGAQPGGQAGGQAGGTGRGGAEAPLLAPLVSSLAVTNGGGVLGGVDRTDDVTAALLRAQGDAPLLVQPVKRDVLDEARRQGGEVGGAFASYAVLGTMAGALLIALTVVVVVEQRRRTHGELRALGLRRGGIVATVVCGVLVAAVGGAAAGALCGAVAGRIAVGVAQPIYAPEVATSVVRLQPQLAWPTLVGGAATGALLAMVAAVAAGAVAARRAVVPALADLTLPPRRLPAGALSGAGVALVAVGVALWRWAPVTRAATLVAGVVVVTAAVVLVVALLRGERSLAAAVGRTPVPWLAFAYPRARLARTGAVLLMFAVTTFAVSSLLTVARTFEGQAEAAGTGARLGGEASVYVVSNAASPFTAAQAAAQPDVAWVVMASTRQARAEGLGEPPRPVTVVAPDTGLADHGPPALVARAPGVADDAEAWRRTLADPGTVLVGADALADVTGSGAATSAAGTGTAGLPSGVPSAITVRDRLTGTARTLQVLGVVGGARFGGEDHVYTSAATVGQLAGATSSAPAAFVGSTAGTSDERLAAEIMGDHPAQVVRADSFAALAADQLRAQQQFLQLLAAYSAIGVVAGVVATAVLTSFLARERRRDLGALRAIGFRDAAVRRLLRIEALVLAVQGILVGSVVGVLAAWRITPAGVPSAAVVVPWGGLAVMAATTIGLTIAAVWVASTVTVGVRPADALRG